ncbi:MgtC/SapB family protein [Sediminicoccus sp. BL-A-41-H5]|uniref:MgtC/SapB family protein n=1 Tax=Sediminicoccus sp. BL-A-41-H5 TaxID=3421106 RepID=UPI003D672806
MTALWTSFAVALGIGLLIGLERERSKGEGPTRRPAGIRTFALASILGAVAFHLGGTVLLAVALAGVIGLTATSYIRGHETDHGLTTELGLLAMPLLGALAMVSPLLAAALAAAVAVVFAAKAPLHGFVKGALTDAEVKDGLMFAIATLVIWPLVPDRQMGPFNAINPHNVWLLVILMLAIGAAGHAATRLLGARYGLPVAGLAAGFISSTATIGSMAARVVKDPASMGPAVAGAAFSTCATFLQMAVLLFTISQATLVAMAPMLVAGTLVAIAYALVFAMRASASRDIQDGEPGRAFSLGPALGLAAMMAVMLVVSAAMKDWFGEAGVIAGAAVAGIVDTHSAGIAVASLVATSGLSADAAIAPILAAMTTNAAAKIVMAISLGTRGFALRIVPGVVISMLAAWTVAAVMLKWG